MHIDDDGLNYFVLTGSTITNGMNAYTHSIYLPECSIAASNNDDDDDIYLYLCICDHIYDTIDCCSGFFIYFIWFYYLIFINSHHMFSVYWSCFSSLARQSKMWVPVPVQKMKRMNEWWMIEWWSRCLYTHTHECYYSSYWCVCGWGKVCVCVFIIFSSFKTTLKK